MANDKYPEYHPVYLDPETGVMVEPNTSHLADEDELEKDGIGFTHPNLHRRIDPQQPEEDSGELQPRSYTVNIYGGDSYRTTTIYVHDEDSETSEIP